MLYGPQPSMPASPLAVQLHDARRSGTMCDVVFVADGREFHAHKAVVSARSAVFHSMFGSTFLEARDGRAVIEGVSANAFDKFLEFLYLDHISDWGELELELLQLADRYMVDHLKV
ncbi:hypothetical protein ONE63_004518 [Megalurothrips usitatus]|uniref:BTB domain-containing protein n=1 Tax=Megalurothrips usitatus TaxID=439358 RepID=A0AAV7X8P0_9NEOP|nr:hypothetical protein ONE63_004518 [Megalurothrips usitatus]